MPSVGRYHRNIFLEKKRYQSALMQRSDLGSPSYIIDADFRDWADIILRKNQRALQDLFNVLDAQGNNQSNLAVVGDSFFTFSPQDAVRFPNLVNGTTLERDTEAVDQDGNANPNFGNLSQIPNTAFNFVLGGFKNRADMVVDSPEHCARAYVGGFSSTLFDDTDFRCLNKTGQFNTDSADFIHRKWTATGLNYIDDDRALFYVDPATSVGFYKQCFDNGRPAYVTLYNGVYKIIDNTETRLHLENYNPEVRPTLDAQGQEQGVAIPIPSYTSSASDSHRYYFIRARYNPQFDPNDGAIRMDAEIIDIVLDVHLEDHGMEEDPQLNHNPGGSPVEGMRRNKLIQQVFLHFQDPYNVNGDATPTPNADYTDLGGVRHYVRSIGRIIIRPDGARDQDDNIIGNGNAPRENPAADPNDDPDRPDNPDIINDGEDVGGGGGAGGAARYYQERCFSEAGSRGQAPFWVGLDIDRESGTNAQGENLAGITQLNIRGKSLEQIAAQPSDLADRFKRSQTAAVVGPSRIDFETKLPTTQYRHGDGKERRDVPASPAQGEYMGATGIQAALDCPTVREVYVRPGTYYIDNIKSDDDADFVGRQKGVLLIPHGKTLHLDTNAILIYTQEEITIPGELREAGVDETPPVLPTVNSGHNHAIILGEGSRLIGGNVMYLVREGSIKTEGKYQQVKHLFGHRPNIAQRNEDITVDAGASVSELDTVGGSKFIRRAAGVYDCRISCGIAHNTLLTDGTGLNAQSRSFEAVDFGNPRAIFHLADSTLGVEQNANLSARESAIGFFEVVNCTIRSVNTQILIARRDQFVHNFSNMAGMNFRAHIKSHKSSNADMHTPTNKIIFKNNNITYYWNILSRKCTWDPSFTASLEPQEGISTPCNYYGLNNESTGSTTRGAANPGEGFPGQLAERVGGAKYAAFFISSYELELTSNVIAGNNTCLYTDIGSGNCWVTGNAFKAIMHMPFHSPRGGDTGTLFAAEVGTGGNDQDANILDENKNLPISWAGPFMLLATGPGAAIDIAENVFKCDELRDDDFLYSATKHYNHNVNSQFLNLPDHMIYFRGGHDSSNASFSVHDNYIEYGIRGITVAPNSGYVGGLNISNNDLFEIGKTLVFGGHNDGSEGQDLQRLRRDQVLDAISINTFATGNRQYLVHPDAELPMPELMSADDDPDFGSGSKFVKHMPPICMVERIAIVCFGPHTQDSPRGLQIDGTGRNDLLDTSENQQVLDAVARIEGNGLYLHSGGTTGIVLNMPGTIKNNVLINKLGPDPKLGASYGSIGISVYTQIRSQERRGTGVQIQNNQVLGFSCGMIIQGSRPYSVETDFSSNPINIGMMDPAAVLPVGRALNVEGYIRNSAYSVRTPIVTDGYNDKRELPFPSLIRFGAPSFSTAHRTILISNNEINECDMGIINSSTGASIKSNKICNTWRFGIMEAFPNRDNTSDSLGSDISDNTLINIGMGAVGYMVPPVETKVGETPLTRLRRTLGVETSSGTAGDFTDAKYDDSGGKTTLAERYYQKFVLAMSPVWGAIEGTTAENGTSIINVNYLADIPLSEIAARGGEVGAPGSSPIPLRTLRRFGDPFGADQDHGENVFGVASAQRQKIGPWFSGIVSFGGTTTIQNNVISNVAACGILNFVPATIQRSGGEISTTNLQRPMLSKVIKGNTISNCTEGITSVGGYFDKCISKPKFAATQGFAGGYALIGTRDQQCWVTDITVEEDADFENLEAADAALCAGNGNLAGYLNSLKILDNHIFGTTFHGISVTPRIRSLPSHTVQSSRNSFVGLEISGNTLISSTLTASTSVVRSRRMSQSATQVSCGQALFVEACTGADISNNKITWTNETLGEIAFPNIFASFWNGRARQLALHDRGFSARVDCVYRRSNTGDPSGGTIGHSQFFIIPNETTLADVQTTFFTKFVSVNKRSSRSFVGMPTTLDLMSGSLKWDTGIGVLSGTAVAIKNSSFVTFNNNKVIAATISPDPAFYYRAIGPLQDNDNTGPYLSRYLKDDATFTGHTVIGSVAKSGARTLVNSNVTDGTNFPDEVSLEFGGSATVREFFIHAAVGFLSNALGVTTLLSDDFGFSNILGLEHSKREVMVSSQRQNEGLLRFRHNANSNLTLSGNHIQVTDSSAIDAFGCGGHVTLTNNKFLDDCSLPEDITVGSRTLLSGPTIPTDGPSFTGSNPKLDQIRHIRIVRGAVFKSGETTGKASYLSLGVSAPLSCYAFNAGHQVRALAFVTVKNNEITGTGMYIDMNRNIRLISGDSAFESFSRDQASNVISNNTLIGLGISFGGGNATVSNNDVTVFCPNPFDDRPNIKLGSVSGRASKFVPGTAVQNVGMAPANSALWISEPIYESYDPRQPIDVAQRSNMDRSTLVTMNPTYGINTKKVVIADNILRVQPIMGQMLVNSMLANTMLAVTGHEQNLLPYVHLDAPFGRAAGIYAGVGENCTIQNNHIQTNVSGTYSFLESLLPISDREIHIPSSTSDNVNRSLFPESAFTGSIGILFGNVNMRSKRVSQSRMALGDNDANAIEVTGIPDRDDPAGTQTPVASTVGDAASMTTDVLLVGQTTGRGARYGSAGYAGRRAAGSNIVIKGNTLENSAKIVGVVTYGTQALIQANTLKLGLSETGGGANLILNHDGIKRIKDGEEHFISAAGDSCQALIYLFHEAYSTPIVNDPHNWFGRGEYSGKVYHDSKGNEFCAQTDNSDANKIDSTILTRGQRPAAVNVVNNHVEPCSKVSTRFTGIFGGYPFDSSWNTLLQLNGIQDTTKETFDDPVFANQYLGYIFTSYGRAYPYMRKWHKFKTNSAVSSQAVHTGGGLSMHTVSEIAGDWPPQNDPMNNWRYCLGARASYDGLEPLVRGFYDHRNNVPGVYERVAGGQGLAAYAERQMRAAAGPWSNVLIDSFYPKPIVFTEAEMSLCNIAVLPMTFGGRGPSRIGINDFVGETGSSINVGASNADGPYNYQRAPGQYDFRQHDFNLVLHSSFSGLKGTPADLLEIYNNNLRYYGPTLFGNTEFLGTGHISRQNAAGGSANAHVEHILAGTNFIDFEDVFGRDQFELSTANGYLANDANTGVLATEENPADRSVSTGNEGFASVYPRVIDSFGLNIPAGNLPFHSEVSWMEFGISRYVLPTIPLQPQTFISGTAVQRNTLHRSGGPFNNNRSPGMSDLSENGDAIIPTHSLDHFWARRSDFGIPLHFFAYRPVYNPTNGVAADRATSVFRVSFALPFDFITGIQSREKDSPGSQGGGVA